ncbi:MAG: anthranilate synthase component I [Alphaproteobacteria bacterium]|nr:anthranilate synthase component I [Alphaproteobacteria bacterium]
MTTQTPRLQVRRRVDDTESPVSAVLKLGATQTGVVLFESVVGGETRGRYSFVGLQPDLWWRVRNGVAETSTSTNFTNILTTSTDVMASLRQFIDDCSVTGMEGLPPMAAGAFGYLGYDFVRYVEKLPQVASDPNDVPEALLMRPSVVLIFDGVRQEIILTTPERDGAAAASARLDAIEARLDEPQPAARPSTVDPEKIEFASNTEKARYLEMVETAKSYIRAGDIFQVVPSQRFSAPFPRSPFAFYRALRRLNPSPFMFYVNFGDFQVSGSSPEILVRLRDDTVTVRPIAGTLPRGATPEADLANETALLSDPKERAEHLMLLDLGRNDVGRVSRRNSVKVTESFTIERYSHVMHIVSNVEGKLKPGEDMVSALAAGFPAGTVSGAPKIRAMEIISELEPHARGVYGGGIGYFGAGGDMDTCIALRTAVFKDGKIHVQAGGGVVFDSDPEKEFQETVHKASALFRAAEEAARYDRGNR